MLSTAQFDYTRECTVKTQLACTVSTFDEAKVTLFLSNSAHVNVLRAHGTNDTKMLTSTTKILGFADRAMTSTLTPDERLLSFDDLKFKVSGVHALYPRNPRCIASDIRRRCSCALFQLRGKCEHALADSIRSGLPSRMASTSARSASSRRWARPNERNRWVRLLGSQLAGKMRRR